ncbi:MAG: hypothetical protein EBR01_02815 [Proteobacteria bacterium]|nr:hypothetical protein [Pseudomonadota bacterium]
MPMDPLEKDRLRKKMATQMGIFLGGAQTVSCVSSHYFGDAQFCELCGQTHSDDIFVVKNRAGKKTKLSELKVDFERRKAEAEVQRQEERKRLEKKVIVRKRPS